MLFPLQGIKVIDLTQYQQGPISTMMLADWGAEVIKVERRGLGDPGRRLGSPGQTKLQSYYFEAYNRNKISICLDVTKEKGKEIIYKLTKTADLFAQNFRVGVAKRLGFDFEILSQINPRIIYLTGSGFGLKGPLRDKPAYDAVGQAMSGILSVTGAPDSPDQMLAVAIADQTGGYMLCIGALLALFDRERSGEGQEVDVSLLGSTIALQGSTLQDFLQTGVIPKKLVARMSGSIFSCAFKAGDGKSFVIQVTTPEARATVFKIAGLERLMEDPKFQTDDKIRENMQDLIKNFEVAFATKTRQEWLNKLLEADIVCAPIYNYIELASDPQVIENEYILQLNHPKAGPIRMIGNPIHLSNRKARVGIAPELGSDTEVILKEIGYSEPEIADLRKQEVI